MFDEMDFQGWIFAALAFIYGLMILTVVIATLAKSARPEKPREEKSS